MIEWLSWLPYKSSVVNSHILDTSKDRPNTPPSLDFLKQRIHELVGGSIIPLDNVVRSKRLRSGRVKKSPQDNYIISSELNSFIIGFLLFLLRLCPTNHHSQLGTWEETLNC